MTRPIIYQIFTRLYGAGVAEPRAWGRREENGCGTMSALDDKSLMGIRNMGFTHVWCTGLLRHATCTHYVGVPDCNARVVKGIAGSPYSITDYYDIDPDLADVPENRLDEFASMLCRIHKAGLKLVMDFVPNHVSREYHSIMAPEGVENLGAVDNTHWAFSPLNNFYYIPGDSLHIDNLPVHMYANEAAPFWENPARATGNDVFSSWPGANDWYETVKLNYGVNYADGSRHFDPVPSTWSKMTDILLHWASKGVDAFRCDMAEMVPVEFWQWAIAKVKQAYPEVRFIAEVYNPAQYRDYIHRGGFDYLYDKVGLYDTVRGVMCGQTWAGEITHAWQSVDDIRDHMLGFLENHDEQRIASPQFAGNAEVGQAGMAATALIGKAPVMVYFGQEIGEPALDAEGYSGKDGRTTIFDYWTVDSIRRMRTGKLRKSEKLLKQFYNRLLVACNSIDALREGALFDLMYVNPPSDIFDAQHTYAFLRYTAKEAVLVVCNFTAETREQTITLPAAAFGKDMLKEHKRAVGMQDALSDYALKSTVVPNGAIMATVPARSAVALVWKN